MGRYIIVVGSPGAGKTTITSSVKAADLPKGLKLVNVGSLMLDAAKRLKYVKSRDEIRYLDPARMDKLRTYAFSKLANMAGKVVVDTHGYVEEHGRFVPGLPLNALSRLHKIEAFIYVDAPEVEMLSRRRKDTSRKREIEDPEILKTQRMLNLSALSYYSSAFGMPVYVIENRSGTLQESIKRYSYIVHEVFGSGNAKKTKK